MKMYTMDSESTIVEDVKLGLMPSSNGDKKVFELVVTGRCIRLEMTDAEVVAFASNLLNAIR